MLNVFAILSALTVCIDATTLPRLKVIVPAMLAMTNRVTMLGISRWTKNGGSYRTIQRFFNTPIEWKKLNWSVICNHFLHTDGDFIIAIDETVITKAGWKTYGLNRFFSSIYGKTVNGLSFYVISIISTKSRVSFPVMVKQVIHSKKELNQKDENNSKSKKNKRRGRSKGSKNKNKSDIELPPHLLYIQNMLKKVQLLINKIIPLKYVVLDGAFGDDNAVQMVLQYEM